MSRTIFIPFLFILSFILLISTACQEPEGAVEQAPVIDEDALVEFMKTLSDGYAP